MFASALSEPLAGSREDEGRARTRFRATNSLVLNVTLSLTLLITVLQLFAALLSNSLALLADALSVSKTTTIIWIRANMCMHVIDGNRCTYLHSE